MHRPTIPALAVLVLAAIAFPVLPAKLAAQTPDSANAGPVDPPDTVYSTPVRANDPAGRARSLPIIEHHRAFLPEQGRSFKPHAGRWVTKVSLGSCYGLGDRLRGAELLHREHSNVGISSSRPTCRARTTSITWPADGRLRRWHRVSTTSSKCLERGSLSLADYPYSDACVPPASAQLVARAHDFRVHGLNRVDISRPDDAKGQLARSTPVLIRFYVSTAFQKLRDASTFTEPAPAPGDKLAGWHRDDTGRLRRAAASVPVDQFLESALGRSWLRLDQLRSVEDPHQRRLRAQRRSGQAAAPVVNVPPPPPTTAATVATASSGAATAPPPAPCRQADANWPTCRRCHAPASTSRREAANQCCPVTSPAMTTSTGSN